MRGRLAQKWGGHQPPGSLERQPQTTAGGRLLHQTGNQATGQTTGEHRQTAGQPTTPKRMGSFSPGAPPAAPLLGERGASWPGGRASFGAPNRPLGIGHGCCNSLLQFSPGTAQTGTPHDSHVGAPCSGLGAGRPFDAAGHPLDASSDSLDASSDPLDAASHPLSMPSSPRTSSLVQVPKPSRRCPLDAPPRAPSRSLPTLLPSKPSHPRVQKVPLSMQLAIRWRAAPGHRGDGLSLRRKAPGERRPGRTGAGPP